VQGRQERRFNAAWSREDAQTELAKRLAQIEAGAARLKECTLQQLADEYLAYKENGGKRSVSEDRRMLTTRLLPALGVGLKVRQLREPTIAQYAKARLGDVSAYTIANELAILRHMLRLARKWGYLDQVPEIEMPKRPDGRQRYLEEDEITRLLKACGKSKNPYLAAIVTIALNTGMRKTEILELQWQRIDLSSARITLYRTKSGKPRGVPMNRAVYDALVALQPDEAKRAGLVFARADGRAWGQIRTAFSTALETAEIKGFRFHDLRHTAASHMVMRGAGLKDVQEILGHADMKMTMRYSHLSPAHLRATVDRLDGLTPSTDPAQGFQHKGQHNADKIAAHTS
jgi:integrase